MAEIHRHRIIRPSTWQESSINYKVSVEGISVNDTLVVEITHESNPFREIFRIEGKELIGKKSIHFQVVEHPSFRIIWKGIKTSSQTSRHEVSSIKTIIKKKAISETTPRPNSFSHLKTSLQPIEDSNIKILILGTMPGEQSLLLQQYYANPRNRFWNNITAFLETEMPDDYFDKIKMLLKNGIGLWDVLHKAQRKSSLDRDIKDGKSNNLESFILNHKLLNIIAFNGTKAEKLYDQNFPRLPNIRYVSLPSSSPANTNLNGAASVKIWMQKLGL